MERDQSISDAGETQSAVAWGAVLAGAAAAVAASFVLVALVGGLGLLLPTPWPGGPGDILHFNPILGALMIAIQVLASALGGYLAGRLRTRWTHIHGHERHFRDTAHGLLAWAASVVAGLILVATVVAPAADRAAAVAAAAMVEASVSAQGPAPA